ncbi:hypothetical protein AXK30_05940 [Escherichia coli]|nr:hypothetical protein AXK30_05940 [Escherichia coli]
MKNCLLSAAAQLHRPLSWLCFQMYALLLLQLMDHRKQVTRLGFPFDPSIRMRLMLDYYYYTLYTTNFTEPLSYQDSAFLKLPKFP